MKSSPIRTALVGVGGYGASHLKRLESPNYADICQLVALADPCFGQKDNHQNSRYRTYSSLSALLENEKSIDAVIISTPIPLHEEMAKACIQKGLHVLLEKPPIPLIQQLHGLISMPGHEKVSVAFQTIVSEPIQVIKRWIMEGRLGRLTKISIMACAPRDDTYYQRASWAGKLFLGDKPSLDGPATNALSHSIHNMMYLAGDQPETFALPQTIQGELYRVRPGLESYDTICFKGELESGAHFHAAMTHASNKSVPTTLQIDGEKGWVKLSQNGNKLESSWGHVQIFQPQEEHCYQAVYQNLVKLVKGECRKPISSLDDTRGYLLTTNGALLSSGKIHTVDTGLVNRFEQAGKAGYEVAGMDSLIQESSEKMALFSEMNMPWSGKGSEIAVRDIRSIDLRKFLSHQ